MTDLSTILRATRRKTGYGPKDFATLVELPELRVRALERVGAPNAPTPAELEAYARVLGLTIDGLVAGEASSSPVTRMLMRATRESGRGAVRWLAERAALAVLGDFARSVRILHDLVDEESAARDDVTTLLDRGRYGFERHRPADVARRAAADARCALRLTADEPISSMRGLLRGLNVPVVYTDPDELLADIDGCSVAAPRPAILVNLVASPSHWWRTRMTLAHELCHLLLDHQRGDNSLAIVSPDSRLRAGRARLSFFDGYQDVEARANAFAAYFLAPDGAVRACVGDNDPTCNASVDAVCQGLGVGRIVAVHRLGHTFELAPSVVGSMQRRGAGGRHALDHPDVVAPSEVGILAGEVRDQVLAATARGRLSPVEARQRLRLELTEPLPDHPGLDETLRRPLRDKATEVCRVAQRHLDEGGTSDRVAIDAWPAGGGWVVRTGLLTNFLHPASDVRETHRVSFDLATVAPLANR